MRNFSGVLIHSLNPEALLKQFLLLLREIIGVNRAVIFLRKPASLLSESAHAQEDRWLRSACAIGLEQSFLEHFALSLGAGIGACLRRQGRILKATSPEAQSNREIVKEFQLLGAQVAIPILDRETLIGVAVFDERLTGEPYANEELALIFHMLEEVGLAIRNSWLHDQLVANHGMVADILGHARQRLRCGEFESFDVARERVGASNFSLQQRRKAADRVCRFAAGIGQPPFHGDEDWHWPPPFKYQSPALPEITFQVTISPFRTQNSANPNAALLIIEDITQMEKAQRLEIETSSLRLITAMAEHLAHEIGNSVVPISTHQQLLLEKGEDPEFQQSLSLALSSGVKRISRLSNQMMFLARGKTDFGDQIRVSELISEAFRDAYTYHNGQVPECEPTKSGEAWMIAGDKKALRHAFSEVILNALQANPTDPNVIVRVTEDGSGSKPALRVEVHDTGARFYSRDCGKSVGAIYSPRAMSGLVSV